MTEAPCRLLEWDTQFFGYRVARVEAQRIDASTCEAVLAWCRHRQVTCLYFLAAADDAETVRVSEQAGFAFVDIRLVLALDLERSALGDIATRDGTAFRDAIPADVPALERIAADVHRDSRFFFDARVPRERAEALYTTWIRRSILEGFADHVIVAEVDGAVRGYVTGRREADGTGSIGLIGVSAEARGRSVGSNLVRASLTRFASDGIKRVTVVTQGRNVGAQRTYQRAGFLSHSVRLWYHKWFQ